LVEQGLRIVGLGMEIGMWAGVGSGLNSSQQGREKHGKVTEWSLSNLGSLWQVLERILVFGVYKGQVLCYE
jgi:hypothetical protein